LLAVLVANPAAADGDPGSLRALISEANATPGADTIQLPAGDYQLSHSGLPDDTNERGDLDITDDLTIVGQGDSPEDVRILGILPGVEIALDRVFDIHGSIDVEFQSLQISGGVTVFDGGGIRNVGGRVTVRDSLITNNEAEFRGGGIFNDGALMVIDSVVNFNRASQGGGIYQVGSGVEATASLGETYLAGSYLAHNTAYEGGGIWTSGGVRTKDSWLDQNFAVTPQFVSVPTPFHEAPFTGAGIAAYGSAALTIDRTTFSYNRTQMNNGPVQEGFPSFGGGLALFSFGHSTIINSTFSSNQVEGYGGGIYVGGQSQPVLDLTNVTIAQNYATVAGGGIYSSDNLLTFNLVLANQFGVSVTLANTIVGDNLNGDDLRGPFESKGNNLVEESPTGSNYQLLEVDMNVMDITGEDPMLMYLRDNGGFGWTHQPLEGSLAIDNARNDLAPMFDQRLVLRPNGLGPDIGAVEQTDLDYGDAPDIDYSDFRDVTAADSLPGGGRYDTLHQNNGARHALVEAGPVLGMGVDPETDGFPSPDALGDDNNDPFEFDDEDGVATPIQLPLGATTNIEVTSATGGTLNVWIDVHADGDFLDADDHVVVNHFLQPGSNMVPVPIPAYAYAGHTFARFRINGEGGLMSYGFAPEGEVEDYVAEILEARDNQNPTANPDEFCFDPEHARVDNVLANDTDPNGDPLTAHLVEGPQYGSLDLDPNGQFTYTPQANFFGADKFTYYASDGLGNSNTTEVWLKSDKYQFIEKLYHDLLGRQGSYDDIMFWVGWMVAGDTPADIVRGFQGSYEYRFLVVEFTYHTLLGRGADDGGRAFWINQLGSGLPVEQLFIALLISAEYYQNHGGTNSGFVEGLYEDLLGRGSDVNGSGFWTGWLDGGASRYDVAKAFVISEEFYRLLINNPLGIGPLAQIGGFYQHFLKRDAEPEGVDFWVAWFRNGDIFADVQIGFLAGPEYLFCVDHVMAEDDPPSFE